MDEQEKIDKKKEIKDWAISIAVAIIVGLLIRTFVFEMVIVKQTSMYPTLNNDDKLGLNKLAYTFSEPDRGDIVVIKIDEEKNYVKRVVALEGERISIKNNTVYINGEPLSEDYLPEGLEYNDFEEIVVPQGCFFAMGDNRPNSIDSRVLGSFSLDAIRGKVVIRFYPFKLF